MLGLILTISNMVYYDFHGIWLTSHMKAPSIFLDIHPAIRSGTILRVRTEPPLCLLVIRVSMFELAVVLIARHALVPGNLVLKAHFEGTLVAVYVWFQFLRFINKLTAVAAFAKTPAEVGIGREMV
jgi:hypothetical protein